MQAGIAVARWYGREARRFYEGCDSQAAQEQREQQQVQQELLEKIRKQGGTITPRAMGRLRLRWANPQVAKKALQDLEQAGYGKCVEEPAEGGRGRPSFCFKLNEYLEHPVIDNNAETPEISIFVNVESLDNVHANLRVISIAQLS